MLYTALPDGHAIYSEWPLPYAAIRWIVAHHPSDDFRNPRISFQHQASRMQVVHGPLKRARAWACWALVCQAKPSLTGDTDSPIATPSHTAIHALLLSFGHRGEADDWPVLTAPDAVGIPEQNQRSPL